MVKINNNLLKINKGIDFALVSEYIDNFIMNNPNVKLDNLGIGDVSKPVIKIVRQEMKKAINDLGNINTFKGYGFYSGHHFLKENIIKSNPDFLDEEIFISCGTKTDITNILELFSNDSLACVFNPSYPVYRDALDIMGIKYEYLEANETNDFCPLPTKKYDIVYICSPSNPLGIAYNQKYLQKWIDYAIKNKCIILYDNVYDAFITSLDIPKSIYELPGAKKVAIEFKSFSKKASFTGIRCSYYIIPKDLIIKEANKYWHKRVMTKFNGADYIAQRGAKATYNLQATKKIRNNINDYLKNAQYLKNELEKMHYLVYGGTDSPYLWVKINNKMKSWDFFEYMIKKLNIIIIPGIVFGSNGDNYFRISALAKKEHIYSAIERIKKYEEKN